MKNLFNAHRIFFLAWLLVAACVTTARAQAGGPYEITKPTIAAGSNTSAGGNYVIIGTMAQHDAVVMGGPYLFDGGFWPDEIGFPPAPGAEDVKMRSIACQRTGVAALFSVRRSWRFSIRTRKCKRPTLWPSSLQAISQSNAAPPVHSISRLFVPVKILL